MNKVRLKAFLLLLAVSVIWGVAGPVIKLTLHEIPPFIFLTYRFLISSIVAIPILYFTKFKLSKNPKTNLKIFFASFLNTTGALGLLFWGAEKTTLLQMSLITVFGPIFSILAGYIFLHDHITKREKIGIIITFLGSLIIIIEPFLEGKLVDGNVLGNLAILGYVLSTAIAGLFMKEVLKEGVSPIGLTNLSFIVGFITILPIVILFPTPFTFYLLPFNYHLGVWYMALISGTLAFSLQNMAQKSIELSEAAVFMYLYPIISGILAIFVLGDKFTIYTSVGSTITIIGIAIAEIKKRRYN